MIIRELCKALKTLHDKGIAHRNLMSDNIFINFGHTSDNKNNLYVEVKMLRFKKSVDINTESVIKK